MQRPRTTFRLALLLTALLTTPAFPAQTGDLFPNASDKPADSQPAPPPSPTTKPTDPPSTKPAPATQPAIPAPPAPHKKPHPPTASALTAAQKLVTDAYKDELAKAHTSLEKATLAQKLLAAEPDEKDPDNQYAILQKARDLAVDAGDASLAIQALNLMNQQLDIDALKLRIEALLPIARYPVNPGQRVFLLNESSSLIDDAVAADRYDIARSAAEILLTASQPLPDSQLKKSAIQKVQWQRELDTGYQEAKNAALTLLDRPNDPEANLIIGKFRCFLKTDWPAGLPLLAKSSDPALKKIANLELAGIHPENQIPLADAWWDAADKFTGTPQHNIQLHAAALYQKSLPTLTGLEKTKIEKRLKSLEPPEPADAPAEKPQLTILTADDFDNKLANAFPFADNLSPSGEATASNHFADRLPQNVFKAPRRGTAWSMDGPKGSFDAKWKDLSARYILLFNRTTTSGNDTWGNAKLTLNNNDPIKLPDFTGKHVLIIDLGHETPIKSLHLEIDGKQYPGLAALQIYRSKSK